MTQNQFGVLISGQCIPRTKQDDGWAGSLRHRQEGPEVGVTGNDDPILTRRKQQKVDVFGSLEADFNGVNSIMSMVAEQ